ncbi:MAG: hypothetical protein O7F11_02970 [Acidobacteria bacterium]|nr:hypothetical protein [Acidobacteriota bacterium]
MKHLRRNRTVMNDVLVLILLLLPSLVLRAGTGADSGLALPGKVGLLCELLAMGKNGTRRLAAQRVVLEPGMSGHLEFELPARSSGRGAPVHVVVNLDSELAEENSLILHLTGEVTEEGAGQPGNWHIRRQVDVRQGTSALVELAPPDSRGQRLALSLTLEEAGNEPVSAPLRRIDLDVEVAAVDGEEVVILNHPMLRSLTGKMVVFAVDYEVPADNGLTFEHVRLDLELTPGFPRGGRLPLSVALAAGFPSLAGAVLTSRRDSRLLRPGEIWEIAVRPPSGGGPWLRVRLIVLWKNNENSNGRGGS